MNNDLNIAYKLRVYTCSGQLSAVQSAAIESFRSNAVGLVCLSIRCIPTVMDIA